MTHPLHWRDARPADRPSLTTFVCTDPPTRRFVDGRRQHPQEWELQAQSAVRNIRFPLAPNTHTVVGLDTDGIVTVCKYQVDPTSVTAFIQVLAVALRVQHRGYGAATLSHVLTLIAAHFPDHENTAEIFVAAKIHHPNLRSKQLCAGTGFVYEEDVNGGELEYWTTTLSPRA